MNRLTITLSLAAAFAAGCSVTHLLRPAIAAENITAQVIHTVNSRAMRLGSRTQVVCAPNCTSPPTA